MLGQPIERRSFLQAGVLGLTGWSLADLLRAEDAPPSSADGAGTSRSPSNPRAKADAVLFVNLGGGPSHLDTLDMKPDGPAETKGEFSPIASKLPGLVVCEHLPKLAAAMDRFTLLRGISHTTGDHPQGQAYIGTGNRPTPALKYPSLGSIATRERPGRPDLPPYVAVPQTEWTAGYMGDAFGPFKTNAVPKPGQPFSVRGISLPNGLKLETVHRRQKLLQDVDTAFRNAGTNSQLIEALDSFGQQAHSMLTSERTRSAFDVGREPKSIRESFAADELGQGLLLSVRLIEQGVRFVTVTNQGWDTHLDNFKGHARLLPPFDAGLTAAVEALRVKGLLERTLVVAMGEFGRTPKINQNVGRDHYPRANWCLLAGAGVRPGQLLGATDAGGTAPAEGTDFRPDDIAATILHVLGIDHEKEYHTKTGRPVGLVPRGRIIEPLFG